MSRSVQMSDDGSDRANVVVTCIGFVLVMIVMWMADRIDGDNTGARRPEVRLMSDRLDWAVRTSATCCRTRWILQFCQTF